MSKHNKKLYTGLGIILILIVSFFVLFLKKENGTVQPSRVYPVSTTQDTQSVMIIAGKTTAHVSVIPGTILYNALMKAQAEGTLTFSGKTYPSLGYFVTDIGTLHSGGDKNLIYYINGKEATVGVSSYTLKGGDIISWKLE